MREALRDFAIPIDLREVLGLEIRAKYIGRPWLVLPGLDERHVLARGVELLEVVDRLIVGRELVVGARLKAKRRRWRGSREAALPAWRRGQASRRLPQLRRPS